MTGLDERPCARGETSDEVMTARRAPRAARWLMLVAVALAGYLLFCHGCHAGDHDNELFIRTFTAIFGK